MQKIMNIAMAASILLTIAACGGNANGKSDDLAKLKEQLEKKKKEKNDADAEIHKLEDQISKLDSNAVSTAKLVSVDSARILDFTHFIDLQGRIDADNIVIVMPRMPQPSQVKNLYIKRGDHVTKGQLLAKLDDAVALQQMEQLKTNLAYYEDLYKRRKNLWDQGIGAEVDVISAKNAVDNLNRQIATSKENLSTFYVYAPIPGIISELNIKEGETFIGMVGQGNGAVPQIQIMNNGSLKMVTDVPENYIARIKKGDQVEVDVPETGKAPFKSTINLIGSSIDPTKRSFIAEAKLPSDPLLKPNQLATMRILDYKAKNAVVVPINVVQSDEKGKYVYVMEKSGNKMVARKKTVIVGESYNGAIEIKSGLSGGEQVITEGYQTVYDGQSIIAG